MQPMHHAHSTANAIIKRYARLLHCLIMRLVWLQRRFTQGFVCVRNPRGSSTGTLGPFLAEPLTSYTAGGIPHSSATVRHHPPSTFVDQDTVHSCLALLDKFNNSPEMRAQPACPAAIPCPWPPRPRFPLEGARAKLAVLLISLSCFAVHAGCRGPRVDGWHKASGSWGIPVSTRLIAPED